MRINKFFGVLCLALTVPALVSCGAKKGANTDAEASKQSAPTTMTAPPPTAPAQLPVRFQSPSYIAAVDTSDTGLLAQRGDAYRMKVGATIRSTGGSLPLVEVMKRLANLKGMTVSWASDVDKNIPVDVDIAANDDFFDAVANLLRQADYFHEVDGKTIVVRNKATKVYQIGIPAIKGAFASNVGGNFLSNKDAASGTEGTVKITSAENNFNVWENIEENLKKILLVAAEEHREIVAAEEAANAERAAASPDAGAKGKGKAAESPAKITKIGTASYSKDGGYFVIDKNVGVITVTAKPSLLKTVDNYIATLKKSLFKQVNIEAKIIEVYLSNSTSLGLNWDDLLGGTKGLSPTITFGGNTSHQSYPDAFVTSINVGTLNFDVLLNALKQQGETHVLANPRITVLNGQPAIISVGKDVAYVKEVTREKDGDTGDITYTAEQSNVVQGIALGVMASFLDDNRVILHLSPITTDIENTETDGSIPLTTVGSGDTAIQLGLPQIKIREMSTMVEVHNGEMLVIGGLIDSVEENNGSFAPGLGDIPVLKYLFGYESKSVVKRELVILLTPRII